MSSGEGFFPPPERAQTKLLVWRLHNVVAQGPCSRYSLFREGFPVVLRIMYRIFNRLALNALGCQDYDKASAYFNKLAGWFPHERGLHYNLAVSLMGAGKYDEARRHLMEEIDLFGERYEALLALGELFYRTNDGRNASRYLRMSLEHCVDDKAASTIRTKIAIAEDPHRYAEMIKGQTLFEKGVAHLEEGDGLEAKRLFRMSLKHDPDNPMTYNNLGVIALNHEKLYETARSYFEKALTFTELPLVRKNLDKAIFLLERENAKESKRGKEHT